MQHIAETVKQIDAGEKSQNQRRPTLTNGPKPRRHGPTVKRHAAFGDCPTCGFPPDQPGFLRRDVPASHPQFGRPVPCPDCHDATLSQRLSKCSQLTGWLRQARFVNYNVLDGNRLGYQAAAAFANEPLRWLALWGPLGTGKTHLCAAIVNACVDNHKAAVYYTLPDLLNVLRGTFKDNSFSDTFTGLVKVPVLVIDEVDKVNWTQWADEAVYALVDARYRALNDVGTVFAMNVEPKGGGTGNDYLYSRMWDNRNVVVKVGGMDVRPYVEA